MVTSSTFIWNTCDLRASVTGQTLAVSCVYVYVYKA